MSTNLDLTASYIEAQGARPLHAGDHYQIQLIATEDGSAINLQKAWMTIKRSKTDADVAALVAISSADTSQIELLDAASGKMLIKFTPALTPYCEGTWYYDVQVIDADSSEVKTVLYGNIEFLPNVTRAIS